MPIFAKQIKSLGIIVGIICLMLFGVACGDTDGITTKDITGTWRALEPSSYVQFYSDGTYRIAYSIKEFEENPIEQGQFIVEGTWLTYITNDDSIACTTGQRGIYEMERTEEGTIRTMLQEDECLRRRTQTVTLKRMP